MKKVNIDRLDTVSFLNGLVFYAPVALLVRTDAGVTMAQFFVLQAVLSLTVFLFEIPTGMITDKIGYKNTMILAQVTMFLARVLLFAAYVGGSYALFVSEAVMRCLCRRQWSRDLPHVSCRERRMRTSTVCTAMSGTP